MQHYKQKGIALISGLIILIFLGFIFTIFLRIVPVYFEDYSIKQAFDSLRKDPELKSNTPEVIRSHFDKYLLANSILVVTSDKLIITDTNDKRTFQLDYEVRRPFIGNIDLLLSFHYQETI